MKKLILGGLMMLCGVIGISVLLIVAMFSFQSLGTLNGSSSVFTYWNYHGVTSFFVSFMLLSVAGIVLGIWGLIDKKDSNDSK